MTEQNILLEEKQSELEQRTRELEKQNAELVRVGEMLEWQQTELATRNAELERQTSRAEAEAVRAEAADRARGLFMAALTHDMKTPMNAVIGYADLLATRLKDAKLSGYVGHIRTAGSSLIDLINDIVDLAKAEQGQLTIEPERVNVRELVAELPSLLGPQASEKGLELECVVAEDVPEAVHIDAARLSQIMVNLAGNAIKFTRRGSVKVHVDASRMEGEKVDLRVVVSDTGIGLSQDEIDRVFGLFEQAGDADSKAKGSGVGLAVVKMLVDRMGGHLRVDSEPGKGTTFSVELGGLPILSP